jgi:ornithine cyclodeaminase/alanine dehydrogenase-like protein (mu-crystallin family)
VAGELGRLINGEIPGRTCNSEITVFKSVGLAIQDAVTAASVYAKAVASGLGRKIKLN